MNLQELVNNAISYGQRGNFSKAIKHLNKALKKAPDNPLILYNLGFAYQNAKKYDMAINIYKRILKLDPDNVDTLLNLGQVYQAAMEFEKAQEIYEKAIRINPKSTEIYSNLGLVYFGQGKIKEAIFCYKEAIKINPTTAKAYSNLGSLYSFLNEKEKAAINFKKAIKYEPSNFKSYNFTGLIYLQQGNIPKAIESFNQALKLNPNHEGILFNLGNAYKKWNSSKAIFYYNEALKIAPRYFDVLSNLYHESREICDWSKLEKINKTLRELSSKGHIGQRFPGETPFDNIRRIDDPNENLRIAKIWSFMIEEQIQSIKPKFDFKPFENYPSSRRIRIGYISGDFRDHPMGYLVRHLFKNHDKKLFEVFAYSFGEDDQSSPRKDVEKYTEHFVDISKTGNVESAKRIYDDRIDILIDLMGFTKDSKIDVLAMKPAPVQINYLGFTGSMGSNFTDYIITDKVLTPPKDAKCYSEKIIYMPDGYQINGDYKIFEEKITRQDFGLPKKGFIFGVFNKPEKIDPVIFDVWMNILKRVPQSVIWIYSEKQEITQQNLKKEAIARGVNPKRIIFAARVPLEMHLARLQLANLALDTRTYSGGATTSQILYMGIPAIAISGKNYISRMASSLVTSAGLPELVVDNLKAYENLAVELASNKKGLDVFKKKLSENVKTGPMFKSQIFVKNLEKAYREIFEIWQNGQKPKQIIV